jgi:hypothetical protein
MQRTQQMANLQINLDNQFVPPPFGTGVTMSVVQVVTDAEGRVVGQPAHQVQAVVPTDLTPELLAALNAKLVPVGLKLERLDG